MGLALGDNRYRLLLASIATPGEQHGQQGHLKKDTLRERLQDLLPEVDEMANGNRILPQATIERPTEGQGQFVLTLPPPPLRLQPLEFGHCTAVSADRDRADR